MIGSGGPWRSGAAGADATKAARHPQAYGHFRCSMKCRIRPMAKRRHKGLWLVQTPITVILTFGPYGNMTVTDTGTGSKEVSHSPQGPIHILTSDNTHVDSGIATSSSHYIQACIYSTSYTHPRQLGKASVVHGREKIDSCLAPASRKSILNRYVVDNHASLSILSSRFCSSKNSLVMYLQLRECLDGLN